MVDTDALAIDHQLTRITALRCVIQAFGTSPKEDDEALSIFPANDLCTLALLTHSGEVRDQTTSADDLSEHAMDRLEILAGPRPPGYWDSLVRIASTMGIVCGDGGALCLSNTNAEILGATCQESFPAFLATWLKEGDWLQHVAGGDVACLQCPNLRLDLIRFLHLFESDKWYPLSAFSLVVGHLAEGQGLSVGQVNGLAKLLLHRGLAVVGAVEFQAGFKHFRVREGLSLPPLPFATDMACGAPSRCEQMAARFRSVVENKLGETDVWTKVADELKSLELRRCRDALPQSLTVLECGSRVEVDPRVPFKDCLFLAKLGRLVSAQREQGPPGKYVFEMLPHLVVESGVTPAEFERFFAERCTPQSLSRLETLRHCACSRPTNS